MSHRSVLRRLSAIVLAIFVINSSVFAAGVNRLRLEDLVEHPNQWVYHSGRVKRAVDGDTVEMEDGTKIRLAGINSPEVRHGDEPAQPGGDEARAWTAERLGGKTIRYYVDSQNALDRFGRTVALIFYWTGGSYNIDMIHTGHAEAAFLNLAQDLKDKVFENAASASVSPRISINSGSYEEIDGLPGVGPVLGQRIIDARPYRSINDLRRVKGIGAKKLADISPFIKL